MAVEKDEVYMKRHIGLFRATGIIVGTVIGTGIFLTPKGITANIGSVGASLIIWLFCGIINTMAAVSLTELGAMIPKAGGAYAFIKEAFGPLVGFVVIWSDALVGMPSILVLMSRTASSYLLQLAFPHCIIPGVITFLAAVSMLCKYASTW